MIDTQNIDKAVDLFKSLPEEQKNAALLSIRGQFARQNDTPEGFRDFYWCIWGREPPPYAMKKWIPKLYNAHERKRGLLLKAFRGSTKSVTLETFALFQLGRTPWGSGLILQSSDKASVRTSSFMAQVIEKSKGWKACFPNVVPDKERGWGAEGYFVMDTSVERSKWAEMCYQDHGRDPSFIGLGVSSGSVVGMHPSVFLLLDDIHDQENTSSEKEIDNIKENLKANVLPTMSRPEKKKPFMTVAYTPWNENDAYAYLEATGLFDVVETPLFTEGGPDEWNGMSVTWAWPGQFEGDFATEQLRLYGTAEFARMMRLDTKLARGQNLKLEWLHIFPADRISITWPVYIGIDFASTADIIKDKDRDYFALAVGRGVPAGGVVLIDGIRERLSTGAAIEKTIAWASMFPTLRIIGVEKWGKGEEFFNLLRGQTTLPIMPMPIKGTAVKSKGERFEKQMGPMFEFSRAWVSDSNTPFLNSFKNEWGSWDGTQRGHDDTLDAVYWMLMVAMGHLVPKTTDGETLGQFKHKAVGNPFNREDAHA